MATAGQTATLLSSPATSSPQQTHTALPAAPRALRHPTRKASGISKIVTASTPNLSSLFSAHSKLASLPGSLQRKASQATLTPTSLATVPDATESYPLASLNGSPPRKDKMPLTPRAGAPAAAGDDLALGDEVDVPGNMCGTVRFVGTVEGKKGIFAGVELHSDFASRGKNNGDVDGVSYFATSVPGAGIFLPLNKAVRREPSSASASISFPKTPVSAATGLKAGTQNSTNFTPPTPSLPQFSKSVGPARAASPLGKKSRPSLPRPESPTRKLQMTPAARPSIATPGKPTPRYGSPTQTKFSKSVHSGAAPSDPPKRGMLQPSRNFSMGPRSSSALSGPTAGFTTDEESTPIGNGRASALRHRAPSRQTSGHDEEIERLRAELEDRDRQLREQSATLADMEQSLTEVQSLMEQAEMPPPPSRKDSLGDKETGELRALVREKNDKIAMLTSEFDSHRADFRSTIDTLELASAETERVYEKRIEELMQDIQQIQERNSDVDVVATQLKQLEELVQELEEGLEDARRGEAEARGEVEFLRGEVERTRTELRREREKAAGAPNGTAGQSNGDNSALFKQLEQKEDEIRGLKAIIHSLGRDSLPDGADRPQPHRSASHDSRTNVDDRIAREKLERQVAELRAALDDKTSKEEDMEHEIEALRRGSAATVRGNGTMAQRSSARDSRDTVVLAQELEHRSPEQQQQQPGQRRSHQRAHTLDTMAESDALSSVTENSTLWCELCETSGHDILTCTNMFGNQPAAAEPLPTPKLQDQGGLAPPQTHEHDEYKVAPLSPHLPAAAEPAGRVSEPVKMIPNLNDPGPVAGKESGIIDAEAWCALCEKDGHNSVDCPFEDAI
ncbi:hypothetical protein N8I77_004311 [Diaporthe amygdali]|uniref:CAP-Gly domain-containing protein n=1 Tax=Phomopsis amygdali TaxID=1214568 RepID=A0AAD9SL18_PHOAM|nr:hypothetical protein N8I77_004311 [Diaporthe amygdali]